MGIKTHVQYIIHNDENSEMDVLEYKQKKNKKKHS